MFSTVPRASTPRPRFASSPIVGTRRGLPLSTTSAAAVLYRRAMELSDGAHAGVGDLLDQAIAEDPTFAIAHAGRWALAHGESDAETAASAREAALGLLDDVSPWERSHIKCLAAMIQREPNAWNLAKDHLAAYPLDLVIAFHLIGDLFFHGGSGKRATVMDILHPLIAHNSGDWAFLARLGFHMSELGDAQTAIQVLARAQDLRPDAPFVAHAMAHALLESGQRAESYRFLLDWSAGHDVSGPLDGHIQWHLSLGELELGQPAVAVDRYLRYSAPGVSQCAAGLLLADAGGLFFRMVLDQAPLDRLPQESLSALLVRLRRAVKIPFVAVHAAALALALTTAFGDDSAEAYLEEMPGLMGGAPTDAKHRVVEALQAYLAGDDRACIEALEPGRAADWDSIGGSNEERALIGRVYASAAARRARASSPAAVTISP